MRGQWCSVLQKVIACFLKEYIKVHSESHFDISTGRWIIEPVPAFSADAPHFLGMTVMIPEKARSKTRARCFFSTHPFFALPSITVSLDFSRSWPSRGFKCYALAFAKQGGKSILEIMYLFLICECSISIYHWNCRFWEREYLQLLHFCICSILIYHRHV